jgi:putative membrane protein insertion efficiency factor
MNAGQHILIAIVRTYRWTLSPTKTFLFGPLGQCRFTPSCSEFALEAIKTHGAVTGGWCAIKRVCRCHPWGGCGHDPVPREFKDYSLQASVPRDASAPVGARR